MNVELSPRFNHVFDREMSRREFLLLAAGGFGAAALACRTNGIFLDEGEHIYQKCLELTKSAEVKRRNEIFLGAIPDLDGASQHTPKRIGALGERLAEWREAFYDTPLHVVSFFDHFYEEFISEELLQYVFQQGCLPMVNLMPRNQDNPEDYYRFAEIEKDEEYLRQLARFYRRMEYPILLRFAFEMNLSPSPINNYFPLYGRRPDNSPEDFVRAWCFARKIFDEEGANNVVWVFSPNVVGPGEKKLLSRYAPPAEYVDVVGADVYDRHVKSLFSLNHYAFRDSSFKELLTPTYETLRRIYREKPFWVTEIGSLRENETDRAWWLGESLIDALNIFGIDGYIYFNFNKPGLSDGDWKITDKPNVARCLSPFFHRPEFIQTAGISDPIEKVNYLREKLAQQIGRPLLHPIRQVA